MYESTVLALGAMGALMLLQLLVADVAGIAVKHVPGSAVPADHNNFLFRATRTVANSNESIAIYLLAVIFCILTAANPYYTMIAAWAFVTTRLVYCVCYYANVQLLRSITFGLSLLCLAALLLIGLFT